MRARCLPVTLAILILITPGLAADSPSTPKPGEPMVRLLVGLLDHENSLLRSYAADELGKLGRRAVPHMIEYSSRCNVADKSLERRVARLVEQLGSDDATKSTQASADLVEIGWDALFALREVAADEDRSAGKRARAKAAIKKITASPQHQTARSAARRNALGLLAKLGRLDPSRVIPLLMARLEDPDNDIGAMAHHLLSDATGQYLGFSSGSRVRAKWQLWWKANAKKIAENPRFLETERSGSTTRLVFTLKDGSQLVSRAPNEPLILVTGFGKLTVPWKKLRSMRHVKGEQFEIVTTLSSHSGVITPSAKQWLLHDGISGTTVTPFKVRYVTWVSRQNTRSYLPWGHHLVAGNGSSRIQEIDSQGRVVWSLNQPNPYSAQRLAGGTTLVSCYTSGPVRELTRDGRVVWQRACNGATDAKRLTNGNTLITEYSGNRVIEVDPAGKVVWQYRTSVPYEADRLPNGNTLIAAMGSRSILEVSPEGRVVWRARNVGQPAAADRLANGNTLVADINGRVLELNSDGRVVWQKTGLSQVYDAHRLSNGNTLVARLSANLISEISPSGAIVRSISVRSPIRVSR